MRSILFIGGCERSGTTMLASLLNASKECVSAPESQFKFEWLNNDTFSEYDHQHLRNDFRFSLWRNDDFIDSIGTDDKLCKCDVFDRLLEFRFAAQPYRYFVDHTPNNFEFYQALKQYFPQAKYLQIIRDGRSVYNSLKSVSWGPKDPITAARWWMKKVGWGLAPLAVGDDIYSVRYEDILENPIETISAICEWMGIEFSEDMLIGDGSFLPSYTEGQHRLVGKGLSKDRIYSWKKYLTDEEVFLFQRESDILLNNLDYELAETNFKMKFYSPILTRIKGRLLTRKGNKQYKEKQEVHQNK